MPPRSSLTSSFAVSDQNNEVVCPLRNADGTNCRKRCLGEKRYRSMQEHIRRAHPDHYLPKLPATEESFQLMINTPPSARPPPPPPPPVLNPPIGSHVYDQERDKRRTEYSSPTTAPRSMEDAYPAAATAAVALAQLQGQRQNLEWDSEADNYSEPEVPRPGTSSSFELPPIHSQLRREPFPSFSLQRPRELLPSMMAHSPPNAGRSTTLPPIQRPRPRKSSLTQSARKPKHERTKSKEHPRRLSVEGRKAFSAEPQLAASISGKRWEDLIEAATSANEADSDRDLTPIPQSPPSVKRASLPPFPSTVSHFEAYKASPLQHALTPPPPDDHAEPFPSVESSLDSSQSGRNFHIPSAGLLHSDSSPTFSQPVQIYCANCGRISVLKDSYACTECISGFCADCVYMLHSESNRGRPCPKCLVPAPRHKPFQLNFR